MFFEQFDKLVREGGQQAVSAAWHALAPLQQVNSTASAHQGVRQLDVGIWLQSRANLAISLPPGANVGHRQIVAAINEASHERQGFEDAPPDLPRGVSEEEVIVLQEASAKAPTNRRVWLEAPRPKLWTEPAVFGNHYARERVLVIASDSACFADWASYSDSPQDLLIGSQSEPESLKLAGRSGGRQRGLSAPPSGSVILVRDGKAETILAPSAT